MQADATAWAGPPQSPHETVPVATLMEGLEKAPAEESAGASAEAAAGAATLLQGLTAQHEELVAPTPATNGGSGVGDVNKDKALKRPRTACEECHVRKLRCDLTECACAGHQWLEPQTISDRRQRIGSRVLSCAAHRDKFKLSHSFGPELFFGVALAEAAPNSRFKLIKHAFGGSKLVNSSWSNEVSSLLPPPPTHTHTPAPPSPHPKPL